MLINWYLIMSLGVILRKNYIWLFVKIMFVISNFDKYFMVCWSVLYVRDEIGLFILKMI